MDQKPADPIFRKNTALIRPHQEVHMTNSGHASTTILTLVQLAQATLTNDIISCRQHQPKQMTQPVFSQQSSSQHGYQHRSYQTLPAFIATQHVTPTQGAMQPDFSNQQNMSKTFRKSVPIVKPFDFDRNPQHWLDWIGLFNTTIKNTDMSQSEKLTHLHQLVFEDN